MKRSIHQLILLATVGLVNHLFADNYGTLIFEDTFERTESQELKNEPGNEWTTSSEKTAKDHKEVDLRDGHVYLYTHAEANHATSFRHAFDFQDGTLGLRFMFDDPDDELTLNFADLELKSVWAGHLFKITIGTSKVDITDQKTGIMDLEIREARKSNSMTKAQEKDLKTKSKSFPHKLNTGDWHQAYATVKGAKITCSIDGKVVGVFKSEGFAHETKRLLRLLVPRNAHVDDVKIWQKR